MLPVPSSKKSIESMIFGCVQTFNHSIIIIIVKVILFIGWGRMLTVWYGVGRDLSARIPFPECNVTECWKKKLIASLDPRLSIMLSLSLQYRAASMVFWHDFEALVRLLLIQYPRTPAIVLTRTLELALSVPKPYFRFVVVFFECSSVFP